MRRDVLEKEKYLCALVHLRSVQWWLFQVEKLVSSFPKFDGLVEGEILLFPAEHTFKIKTSANQKVLVNH